MLHSFTRCLIALTELPIVESASDALSILAFAVEVI